MKGWVYVITNKAMPNLVKVGFSTKDPELRAAELNHTGSPHPYVVEYEMLIEDPYDIEQRTHRFLSKKREGKEWFRCSSEEAVVAIKEIAGAGSITEIYKKVDREKAELLRRQHEVEREKSLQQRRIVNDVETRLSGEESSIRRKYELQMQDRFAPKSYWWFWLGGFFISGFFVLSVFNKATDAGLLIGGAVGATFIAPFLQDFFLKKQRRSDEFLAFERERDAALASVRSIVVPCPKCGQSLRFSRAKILAPHAEVEWHCPSCKTDFQPFST